MAHREVSSFSIVEGRTLAEWASRCHQSQVADDYETLVPLELAAAVRGVSSLDQSPVSQAIPLFERDLHLGRISEGARFALRALAADRKKDWAFNAASRARSRGEISSSVKAQPSAITE